MTDGTRRKMKNTEQDDQEASETRSTGQVVVGNVIVNPGNQSTAHIAPRICALDAMKVGVKTVELKSVPTRALLSIKQTVEYSGVSRATIYRWFPVGRFPRPLKLSPRKVMWKLDDLDLWIASHAVEHNSNK